MRGLKCMEGDTAGEYKSCKLLSASSNEIFFANDRIDPALWGASFVAELDFIERLLESESSNCCRSVLQ